MSFQDFKDDLISVINRHSVENGGNTPDFILAEVLVACLKAFDTGVTSRDKWYGVALKPGHGESLERLQEKLLDAEEEKSKALLERAKKAESDLDAALSPGSAAEDALDEIAKLCGCEDWEYPGQVVRDVQDLVAQRDKAQANYKFMVHRACNEKLDGYRALGQRAADAENRRDAAIWQASELASLLVRVQKRLDREAEGAMDGVGCESFAELSRDIRKALESPRVA